MKASRSNRATAQPTIVVDEITLDGRQIRVQNVELPLQEVKLDPRNPRIANTVAFSMNEEPNDLAWAKHSWLI